MGLRNIRRTTLAVLLIATLSACSTVEPSSALPDAATRHAASLPAAAELKLTSGTPTREWWRELRDPQLDVLVGQALTRNADHQAALAAVRQARALAGLAERDALPQGGVNVQVQAQRPSLAEVDPYDQGLPRPPSRNLLTIGQLVSWEIDLFGRVGTAAAVASRQADAAAAEVHGAAALLQAEVVRRYSLLRLHQHDLAQRQAEQEVLVEHARLMQVREQAGLVDRREWLAATARLAQARGAQAADAAAVHRERAALAVLTGRAPGATDADFDALVAPAPLAELPTLPEVDGITQPTDLLARRPDVAKADAQLRAALGEAVLAERAHLPRLSLQLGGGLNAPLGALGDSGALRYAAGPVLQWDWLDAGRHRARAAAAKAGGEAAWHRFEQVVLQALADSESALRSWQASRLGLQQSLEAEAALRESAARTQSRFRAGLEPPTAALEQTAQRLEAQRGVAARRAEAVQAWAQVQLALAAWQPERDR